VITINHLNQKDFEMKRSLLACQIVLVNLLFCQPLMAKFSFKSITSYFSKKAQEQVIQQEFKIDPRGTLNVKNIHGNVIVNEWNHGSVQLKAIKRAKKEELLAEVDVKTQATEKILNIATKVIKPGSKTEINYELIVPRTVKVNIATTQGSITIKNLNAPVKAKTENGSIDIANTRGTVIASTDQGAIKIASSSGNIRATTVTGKIIIEESSQNVVAKTKKGAIKTVCRNLRSLDTIALSTQSGHIELALPQDVNAELKARTAKGKLTSEHYITTKPQTVRLNKKTWARLRKEVDGTLGTGEATIQLTADSGNIKITKAT